MTTLDLEVILENLSINDQPKKWIHTDKFKAKNERIYIKIRRCLEHDNISLAFELLKINYKRPDFDYHWILKLMEENPHKFGIYYDSFWNFFFNQVFDDQMKLKYQNIQNK
jgi:hypothetical protein